MTLHETIFTRRSVRKYDMTPLSGEILADLGTFLDATEPMAGQTARFEIVSADKVKNNMASHYILAYCTTDSGAYANVGYVLQNADLYLQSKGYGSCWLGMAKPSESDRAYCIMLAFGKTNVPARRNVEEFKRLPMGEISNADNAIAQAARLAPSAVNSQPWKLDFSDGKVTIRYFGRGVTQLMLKKKLNKIDLGIITRHVKVALENEGRTIQSVAPLVGGKDFAIEVIYR